MNSTANNNKVYNQISYKIDHELVFARQFLKTGSYMACRTGWPYFQETHRDLPVSTSVVNHSRLSYLISLSFKSYLCVWLGSFEIVSYYVALAVPELTI